MYTLSLGFPQPSWHRITCINQTNPKDPRAASRLSLWQCCLSFQRLISHPGWRSACTDGWIDGLRVKIKHIISHIDKRQNTRLHTPPLHCRPAPNGRFKRCDAADVLSLWYVINFPKGVLRRWWWERTKNPIMTFNQELIKSPRCWFGRTTMRRAGTVYCENGEVPIKCTFVSLSIEWVAVSCRMLVRQWRSHGMGWVPPQIRL